MSSRIEKNSFLQDKQTDPLEIFIKIQIMAIYSNTKTYKKYLKFHIIKRHEIIMKETAVY